MSERCRACANEAHVDCHYMSGKTAEMCACYEEGFAWHREAWVTAQRQVRQAMRSPAGGTTTEGPSDGADG